MTADVHTLSGAYALNALPADEQRFFVAHLDVCETCRLEVDELRATAAVLGAAAAEPAPAGMRASVLSTIDRTRQDGVVASSIASAPGYVMPRPFVIAVAALFAMVFVGLGATIARLDSRVDALRDSSAQVAAILTAEDARTIEVGDSTGPHGQVVTSPSHGKTVVVAGGLPVVGSNEVLELWLIDEGEATPAGLFRPNTDGRAVQLVSHDLTGVDAVGVTVEPSGGSPQPTTTPILLAEVS